MIRQSLAMAAALSITASPALAQGSAAPLPVQSEVRAGAPMEEGSQLRGGAWLPMLVAATIVVLGVLTATGVIFDDDDDVPVSP